MLSYIQRGKNGTFKPTLPRTELASKVQEIHIIGSSKILGHSNIGICKAFVPMVIIDNMIVQKHDQELIFMNARS